MKKIVGFAAGVILCLPLVGLTTMVADSEYSVGEFAVSLANSLDLKAPPAGFDAASAALALREAGVEIGGDLKGELREADMVDALNQLGLNVMTSTPGDAVSQTKANQILKAYSLSPQGFSRTEATKTKTKKVKGSPKD